MFPLKPPRVMGPSDSPSGRRLVAPRKLETTGNALAFVCFQEMGC